MCLLASVVTPVHNAAEFIAHAIESVIAQSVREWEMLVVDDCSTDSSTEVIRGYASRDSRVRLIHLPANSGPAVARNRAIESAQGRYIAFLDADDAWDPRKLEKQLTFMEENQYRLTYTYYAKIDEAGCHLGETVCPPRKLSYADLLKSNQIGCLTAMYDSAKLGKVYMPLIRKRQDYGLWLKILRREPFAYCLPEVLATYRVRNSSISSSKIGLLTHNWRLFREIEGLSLLRSTYYLGWNVARSILS